MASLFTSLALVVAACGDSDAGESESDNASSTGETTDESASSEAGSESASETDGALEWVPAAGISITSVEINQGTGQDIARGRDWVDPSGRASFIVEGRDAVVRVHFTIEEDWTPREIEARLHLQYLDGASETVSQTMLVESSSTPGVLDSTFLLDLAAADGQTVSGAKFQVELYQKPDDSPAEPPAADDVWQTPADGPNWVGFESDPMQLKLVLVPIHYQADGLDIVAEVNDDDLARIEDTFFDSNPVQDVLIDVHSPLLFTDPLGGDLFSGLSPLLSAVAQLRADENPGPNVYYHALLDQGCQFTGCSQNGGLLGQAINIPGPSMGEANLRVAASMYYKPDGAITELSLETMVHEHGHVQGLMHIFCPMGGSFGNDPTFPDPEGKIATWGLGLRSRQLHEAGVEFDYMSYCRPQWLGPWTWNKTYNRVRELSAWDAGASAPVETYPVLVGAHHGDGATEWWTMDMAIDDAARSAGERVEFSLNGEWVSQPVVVRELSEGDAYWILTPLPAPLDTITQIRHVEGARASAVRLDGIKQLHRAPVTARD